MFYLLVSFFIRKILTKYFLRAEVLVKEPIWLLTRNQMQPHIEELTSFCKYKFEYTNMRLILSSYNYLLYPKKCKILYYIIYPLITCLYLFIQPTEEMHVSQ